MKKMKTEVGLFIYLITLILLCCGFIGLKYYIAKEDERYVEINIVNGNSDGDIYFRYEATGDWYTGNPESPNGAQYDLEFGNSSNASFQNWVIRIDVPYSAEIEQMWNGEYSCSDGELWIWPVDYNREIKSNNSIPIGFIATADGKLKLKNVTVSGQFIRNINDSPLFYVLIGLSIIWAVCFLVYIVLQIQYNSYQLQRARQEKIIVEIVSVVSNFVDEKDPYTRGHSQRVAIYTKELARRMGMSDEMIKNYYFAGYMHDCGKVLIPDNILNKEGKLDPEEWLMMKNHTVYGGNVLKDITIIPEIREGALYHHEHYDGSGYPEHLEGKNIPLVARVIGVADYFDAVSTDRCYHDALSLEEILQRLEMDSGSHFDPEIVPYMESMIRDGFVNEYVNGQSNSALEKLKEKRNNQNKSEEISQKDSEKQEDMTI